MARILVIDDDQQFRESVGKILMREGYEVSYAADGNDGVKRFQEEGADLVIADIIMPEKEGFETIKEIRETRPDTKVIAVSGGGGIEPRFYLHFAKESGATRTLMKPFRRQELLAIVRELMS
jgi:DNA-binding response OmpR family regulator